MLAFLILNSILQQSPSDVRPLPPTSAGVTFCDSLPEVQKQRQQAVTLTRRGKPAAAVRLLERSHQLCPEDADTSRDLASAELAAGDLGAAEMLVKLLLARQNTAELHTLLGAIEAERKEPRVAASEYQIAAAMQPSEQTLFDFGTSLMRLDFGAAASVLAYGTKQFPTSVKLQVAYGLALYAQDRAQEGAEALCHAAELDPTDVHPMEVLADTETIPSALLPRVVSHLSSLSQQHPSDGLLLFDLTMERSGVWSGNKFKATAELVRDLHRALVLSPDMPRVYLALAAVYHDQKRIPEEVRALQHALALAPEEAKIRYRLAFAYRESGDQQRFEQELRVYQTLHAKQLVAK